MAWTTPRTWVAGEIPTAPNFNTHVRDNLDALTTWVSYNPTLTNWSLGNGTLDGWFIHAGDVVDFVVEFVVGSTTTKSGNLFISLPVVGPSYPSPVGTVMMNEDGAADHPGIARTNTAGDAVAIEQWSSGNSSVNPTNPFTWGTGDQLYINGRYRVP